jgi:hypothetical protein
MNPRATQFQASKLSLGEIFVSPSRLFWVLAVAAAIIMPAWICGVPANKDLLNHFRFALPFYDSLAAGNFYPGWLAESNAGYGDPSFRFYPPAVYYLLSLGKVLTGSWYAATLLSITTLSVLSGWGMYFWTRAILPESCAIWAAVLYALAPYHVNEIYQAFLLAEFAGAAVLPFAFGFLERVCHRGRYRDVAGLAATYAILLLTHLPLAVIGSIALAVYALVRIDKRRWRPAVKPLMIAAVLGLAASSFYWIRMISELKWIAINQIEPDASVDYRNNFVFSTLSPDNLNVWWMNILTLSTLLLFAPAAGLIFRRSRQALGQSLKPAAVLSAVALLMALPLSHPVWQLIHPLQQVQFPWRWLAILSLAGSVLAAATIPNWLEDKFSVPRPIRLLVLGSVAVSIAFACGHIVREAEYRNQQQFDNDLQSIRGTASVNYWIPAWASPRPRPMPTAVDAGSRQVVIQEWAAQRRRFEVASGSAIEARVRTFYYPHWIATTDHGQVLPIRADQDGAILISIPANAIDVRLEFHEPLRGGVATGISMIGFLFIGFLASPLMREKSQ